MEDVGGGMVEPRRLAQRLVDLEDGRAAPHHRAAHDAPVVHDQPWAGPLRVLHLDQRSVGERDPATVADLAAGFAVEGRLGRDDLDLLPLGRDLALLAADREGEDLGLKGSGPVAGKARHDFAERARGRGREARPLAGPLALRPHRLLEAGVVDRKSLVAQDVLGQVDRKAVGVVELEGDLAGKRRAARGAQAFDLFAEQAETLLQRVSEALLLAGDGGPDARAALDQFRVARAEDVADRVGDRTEERVREAEHPPLARGAPQQAAQHVAAALVRGQQSGADHDRDRAAVVGDHAEGDILLRHGRTVASPRGALGDADHRPQQVGVVGAVDALEDRRHALEPHAGVDVARGQFGKPAVALAIVLDEDQVPDLHVAGTAGVDAAGVAGRLVAGAGSAVDVNLRARAARAGLAHLPEVVLRAEAQHARGRQVGHLRPERLGLRVGLEDRGEDPFLGQFPDAGEQRPRPLDRLGLVVVAEGPVAEHLEEGVVVDVAPDVIEIVVLARDAQALLGVRDPRGAGLLCAQEGVLEGDHARVREEQRWIALRNDAVARHDQVAPLAEELEETAADLGSGHGRER